MGFKMKHILRNLVFFNPCMSFVHIQNEVGNENETIEVMRCVFSTCRQLCATYFISALEISQIDLLVSQNGSYGVSRLLSTSHPSQRVENIFPYASVHFTEVCVYK